MASTAEAFVKNAKELPVMPPVAAEVMRKAADPDTDLRVLAQLISRDASLAVRVLKIANSSFYAMPREIDSIQQAIVLLGYSTLRSIVVAASMKDVFARFGLAERLLWEHALAAGVAASVVARSVSGFSIEEAFLGGLVHDVGKLVLYSQAESQYQEVMRVVYADEKPATEAEVDVFGFDHAEVGCQILRRWKLPDRMSDAVGGHHDLSRARAEGSKPIAALLQVADRMCHREGHGRRKPMPELEPGDCEGATLIGVGPEDVPALLEMLRESYERDRGVFS